jgi:hypothetical protein
MWMDRGSGVTMGRWRVAQWGFAGLGGRAISRAGIKVRLGRNVRDARGHAYGESSHHDFSK